MYDDVVYDDSDDMDVLAELNDKKKKGGKKQRAEEEHFRISINKRKISKYELDELFLD